MTRKKNADDQLSTEDQALQQRVYEMMELDRAKEAESKEAESQESVAGTIIAPESKPIDIFEDLKAAPSVSGVVEPEPEAVEYVAPAAIEPINLDDEATDQVIKEIVASESDALLAAEDVTLKLKTLPPSPKPMSVLGRLFKG
ncbi:MAG: hypothetical protein JWO35_192 [Candidatus Saccharibacteria bacterium]|nr:hypothetical protein [Candidatus Saccharibacteria bacterium]